MGRKILKYLFFICLAFILSSFTTRCGEEYCGEYSLIGDDLAVSFSSRPLAEGAVSIRSKSNEQRLIEWKDEQHIETKELIQRIAVNWCDHGFCRDYLVVGKTNLYNPFELFQWDIVPFKPERSGPWQRTNVLWRIAYGTDKLSQKEIEENRRRYGRYLGNFSVRLPRMNSLVDDAVEYDPFCDPKILNSHGIYRGKHMVLIYDHRPSSLYGYYEKPHFLIIPLEHRSNFNELTNQEYLEAMRITRALARYFSDHTRYNTLYLHHKTGALAGQSVMHWHLHLVAYDEMEGSPVNDEGKIVKSTVRQTGIFSPFQRVGNWINEKYDATTLFLFMSLPNRKLTDEELQERVEHYRKEFKNYLTKG